MTSQTKIVISASRRTDIPAFYLKWFMDRLDLGFFEVTNPYNQRKFIVPADPDNVHTIVFWSKDFDFFLREGIGEQLQRRGYNLFFNFTINSAAPQLEPLVPPLKNRLEQLNSLGRRFDPRAINWRFDPICFFKTDNETTENNLSDFPRIATTASQAGVERCITSFMDHYPKISRRTVGIRGIDFYDPPVDQKIKTIMEMEQRLSEIKINLYTCCEKEVLAALPPEANIKKSSCIPNDFLTDIYGGKLSLKKDTGQRIKHGCGCLASADIGSYHLHPCYHNCLFCYANPSSPKNITAKTLRTQSK